MPTRPRIDMAGYHHIINRGVNRCNVFESPSDKEMFLQILNKISSVHKFIVHDYCLMDNHYHLLIETTKENLPDIMRIVNANYAQYFNKLYNRSGHLWQDRYKSRYVTSEEYLYTLIRYIEYNPVNAGLGAAIGEYRFTLSYTIFNAKDHHPCCNDSLLLRQFDLQTLGEFLDVVMSEDELAFLKVEQKRKIEKIDKEIVVSCSKTLDEHFTDVTTRDERNRAVLNAYADSYTQKSIAEYLDVSTSLISKVLKS